MTEHDLAHAPGLGASQRQVLRTLKLHGATTIPQLAAVLELNVETVRHHLQMLRALKLVEERGRRRTGRGRPEVLYALTLDAEALFPRREGEVLRALAEHLLETGNEQALEEFFDRYIGGRREEALRRVEHLEGDERLAEVARILSELGFMAQVGEGEVADLRLCHCPLRELVGVTKIPCRAELGFVRELLGERLTRLSYIPAGDASCTYRTGAA